MTDCVVNWSGGASSFVAAQRAVEKFGADRVRLLFCDVKKEDVSTYRAVEVAAWVLGCRLAWVTHPKYPGGVWDLFHQQGMMGKPGAGLCSRILKRETAMAWMRSHYDADGALVVVGMTWEEMHRVEGVRGFWKPYRTWMPMIEEPWLTKDQTISAMREAGVTPPDLYQIGGFDHANCAGACVKAGQGQWAHLLRVRPAVYAEWEREEEAFRARTGKDVAILRDRTRRPGDPKKVKARPLPLRVFREKIESEALDPDLFDPMYGAGCGCFTDMED